MIVNRERFKGVLAALLGLATCSVPLAVLPQSMTVSVDAASVAYEPGTEFNGFVSQTDNPLGPFVAAAVQFTGTNTGGNAQIYRYRLDFDTVVELGSITVSGAAWEGDTLILQDELGNELANLAVESFGSAFQSVVFDVSGISGQSFFIEEQNVNDTWRFRNLISVVLGDGSSPDLILGTTPAPPTFAHRGWPEGNGHQSGIRPEAVSCRHRCLRLI